MAGEQGQAEAEALSIGGLEGSRRLWVLMRTLARIRDGMLVIW
jgi:hypothetical protein